MGACFDLALSYPQWQGSGRHQNLPRGAAAAAEVCGRFAPLAAVPLSEATGDAHSVNRWNAVFEQFLSARDILARHGPKRLLTAGGDCSVDIAAIDYLRGRYPDLTVLWVDAHLDANTPETSPGGNFHGMPVATLMGLAPEPMRSNLQAPLDPARFHYFGIQIGDEGDWALQREFDLKIVEQHAPISGPVHIHFDLDVLEPSEFPYLAYTDGKLAIDDAVALVGRIAQQADLVGLTITEFAPADDDAALEGSKVIARLCEAAASR